MASLSFKAWPAMQFDQADQIGPRRSVVSLCLIYSKASWNCNTIPSIYTMITSHCSVNLLSDVVRDARSVSATSAGQLLVSCNCCELSRIKGWKVTRGVCFLDKHVQPRHSRACRKRWLKKEKEFFAWPRDKEPDCNSLLYYTRVP